MSDDHRFRAVIAGAGPAGLEAALALREFEPAIAVDLLSPHAEYVERPLSVLAPFSRGPVARHPLSALVGDGVDVHVDGLLRVDPARRTVTTDQGAELRYDALLVTTGAQGARVVPNALTFEGPRSVDLVRALVDDVSDGYVRSIAFVAPPGAAWTLPVYELALQTAVHAEACAPGAVELTVVTHELRPLEVFGTAASGLLERLLGDDDIAFGHDTVPPVDRIVALPVARGGPIPGLPVDEHGFIVVDDRCRVRGLDSVWAAGDCTHHALRQGGLATQQAEVAAAGIAATADAAVDAGRYDPMLRAVLVTGRRTWYLARRLRDHRPTQVSDRPLWSPVSKVAGRRLGRYLDALSGDFAALDEHRRVGAGGRQLP